jgi:very-short-patch-repair endonuclease
MDAHPRTLKLARRLRKTMTKAEVVLWSALRGRQLGGLKFRRQHPLGPYVVDFFCVSHRLAIEVDGGWHADADRACRDADRDAWIRSRAIRILRLPNDLVLDDLDATKALIERVAREAAPYPEAR